MPKKRGPKTDVLEALLKRVDGLEKRLKDENKTGSPTGDEEHIIEDLKPVRPQLDTSIIPDESAVYSPTPIRSARVLLTSSGMVLTFPSPSPSVQPDVLLDTYFTRCHGKAYHILDEGSTRQRLQLNQIPSYLLFAIYAVSAR